MNTAEKAKMGGVFTLECYDREGRLKWRDTIKNLVTTEGIGHALDVLFASGTQVATWYVGLTDGTPTVVAGDTLASHTGWTEVTAYTGNRQEFVDVRSGGTVSNSASKATFAITGSATVGGAFLASAASGTTGTLLSGGAFTGGDKSVAADDTINAQYDFSLADDGT